MFVMFDGTATDIFRRVKLQTPHLLEGTLSLKSEVVASAMDTFLPLWGLGEGRTTKADFVLYQAQCMLHFHFILFPLLKNSYYNFLSIFF